MGIVESWEVMMGAIERMRILDANKLAKEQLDDWDSGEKDDWEISHFPAAGLGRGYSTLSKRLERVRTGDWGMQGGKKKTSSLRKEEIF
jgi:hypothetical protein